MMGQMTMENGLSANSVKSIYRDSLGFVFFGTSVGVDMFNGFNVFPISFPIEDKGELCWVSGMTEETPGGDLIVGNNAGLWRLDRIRLELTRIFDKDIDHEVTCVERALDGRVYVGTVKGLFVLEKGKLRQVKIHSGINGDLNVRDVAFQRKGKGYTVWVCMSKGLVPLDPTKDTGGTETAYYNKGDKGSFFKVAAADDGRVFVGTTNEGVLCYNPSKKEYSPYMFEHQSITDLSVVKGCLLVGTNEQGANEVLLSKDAITHRYFDESCALNTTRTRYNNPFCFYRDPQGSDWIGYLFFGVDYAYYTNGIFHRLPINDPEPTVRCFNIDEKGRGLAGTNNGIMKVDGEKCLVEPLGGGLENITAIQIYRYGDNYVVGTINHGAMIIDAHTLRPKTVPALDVIKNENVYVACEDKKGNLWLATTGGLLQTDKGFGNSKLYTPSNSQLPHDEVFCMGFDSIGNAWVSTRGGNCVLNGNTGLISTADAPAEFKRLGMLRAVTASSTEVFLLPQHGFPVAYNISKGKTRKIEMNIGDKSPSIMFFMPLENGKSLICTDNGMFVGGGDTVRSYGYVDGLPSIIFQARSFNIDKNGHLWLSTDGGMAYAKTSDLMRDSMRHVPIMLFSIFNHHLYSPEEVDIAVAEKRVAFTRFSNDAIIDFFPLMFARYEGIRYRYSIDDGEWHEIEPLRRRIAFKDLWPGNYRLHIEAIGKPEISGDYILEVRMTYSMMATLFLLLLLAALAAHIVYCKVKKKEYFWERFLPKPEKYRNSKIEDSELKRMMKQLDAFMDSDKPYLQADLTMLQLSKASGFSNHTLSQLFSQCAGCTYYEYVAKYRIKEFKRRLESPEYVKLTINALAEECGFRSRTTFLSAFKKDTGMTPREYIKQKRLGDHAD